MILILILMRIISRRQRLIGEEKAFFAKRTRDSAGCVQRNEVFRLLFTMLWDYLTLLLLMVYKCSNASYETNCRGAYGIASPIRFRRSGNRGAKRKAKG